MARKSSRKKEVPSKISSTSKIRNRRTTNKKGSKNSRTSQVPESGKKSYATAKPEFKTPNIKSPGRNGKNVKKVGKVFVKRGSRSNKINSEGESSVNTVSENELDHDDAEDAFEHWMSLFYPSSTKSKDNKDYFHISDDDFDGEIDSEDECSCSQRARIQAPLDVKATKLPPSCVKDLDVQPSCSKEPDIELPSEECSTEDSIQRSTDSEIITPYSNNSNICNFCGKRSKLNTSIFETVEMKGYLSSCFERVHEAMAKKASASRTKSCTISADEDVSYSDELPLKQYDPETLTGFERFVLFDLPNMSSDDDSTVDNLTRVDEENINEHLKQLKVKEELSKNMSCSKSLNKSANSSNKEKGVIIQKSKSAKTKKTKVQITPTLIKEDKMEQGKNVEKCRRASKRGQKKDVPIPKSKPRNSSKSESKTVKKKVASKKVSK